MFLTKKRLGSLGYAPNNSDTDTHNRWFVKVIHFPASGMVSWPSGPGKLHGTMSGQTSDSDSNSTLAEGWCIPTKGAENETMLC